MYKIISVDGGGTKTKGALYNKHGKMLREVTSGFSNPLVNYKNTFKHICEVLDSLLVGEEVEIMILGIAGTKEKDMQEQLLGDLKNRYKENIVLITDLELAYYSHFIEKNGIFGIVGTGSAFITIKDNVLRIAGGWGHILQDYGSGYKIAIEVLRLAIDRYELGEYILSEKIKNYYGLEEFSNIKRIVYKEPKDEVARLTPSIFSWIEEDRDTNLKGLLQEVIDREIINLTDQIYNFYSMNFKDGKDIEILFTGGVIKNNRKYFVNIKKRLEEIIPNSIVNLQEIEPVYGGYNLGKRLIERV